MANEKQRRKETDPNMSEAAAASAPVQLPNVPVGPSVGGVSPIIAQPPHGGEREVPVSDGLSSTSIPTEPAPMGGDLTAAQDDANEHAGQGMVSEIQQKTRVDGGVAPDAHGDLIYGGSATARAGLALRSAPGVDAELISQLAEGTTLALLEGPQVHAGGQWWRVHAPDGRTGWVASEELLPGAPV